MPSNRVVFQPLKVTHQPSAAGHHNDLLQESRDRVLQGASYRDCSTVCLLPTRADGKLHSKVSDAKESLMRPMNQKFVAMRIVCAEVADAYNIGIRGILDNPELSKWKFILTMEHDNTPPPDGLIRLCEAMYSGPWAGVGGLYWTKGEGGMPMIYGDPRDPSLNFRPMVPELDKVQECRGIAMGFSLYDMELFRDERLLVDTPQGKGWFRTPQSYSASTGVQAGTQDLDFCARAGALGYRFAVDTRVKVGHVQLEDTPTHPAGFVW